MRAAVSESPQGKDHVMSQSEFIELLSNVDEETISFVEMILRSSQQVPELRE